MDRIDDLPLPDFPCHPPFNRCPLSLALIMLRAPQKRTISNTFFLLRFPFRSSRLILASSGDSSGDDGSELSVAVEVVEESCLLENWALCGV